MIKVAVVAPYPASAVLPDKDLKVRFRRPEKKKQHPAPWVWTLCRELSRRRDVKVEVFTHSRAVARIQKAEKEGVHYTFVPKYEPARFDPYHAYLPALVQIKPRAILCGSEKPFHFQREKIEAVFGYRVFSWYGYSEYLVLGGEYEHSQTYHFYPQYGYIELLPTGIGNENGREIFEAVE